MLVLTQHELETMAEVARMVSNARSDRPEDRCLILGSSLILLGAAISTVRWATRFARDVIGLRR